MCVDRDEEVQRLELAAAIISAEGHGIISEADAIAAMPIPEGNANPFVPWSDPQIPFECYCGKIIYSDTPHTHDSD